MFPPILLGTGEGWTLMRSISVTEYLNYEAIFPSALWLFCIIFTEIYVHIMAVESALS
uniref:Uncharacterized protein n=1 Tax=Rhizophora mucronata TaxID=61149 RepID=A0A2P2QXX4_RHIMU